MEFINRTGYILINKSIDNKLKFTNFTSGQRTGPRGLDQGLGAGQYITKIKKDIQVPF